MLNPARHVLSAQGVKLVGLIAIVYVLALAFVFPGFFAPYWPVHADAYMFIPSADRWLARYAGNSVPRPLGFALEHLLNAGGLRPGLFLNALVPLAGIALTVLVVRRWFAPTRLHPASLLAYLFCVMANPGFYVAHTYDQFANLEYLLAILGLYLWIARPPGAPARWRVLLVSGLVFASAFCKEAYLFSFVVLWAYAWATERSSTRATRLPLLAACLGPISAFAYMRSSGAVFTSGQQTYEVVLAPLSVLKTFWGYLKPDLAWPVFLLLVLAFAQAGQDRKSRPALVLSVAGMLALVPYAFLPHHAAGFYAWSAVPLLTAPVLLIGGGGPPRFLPGRRPPPPWSKWAVPLATLGLAALAPVAWRAGYTGQQWTLDRQQEQRLLLTGLAESNATLAPGSRVLISGMTSVFHPFQWPAFVDELMPNAGRIDFVSYKADEIRLNRGVDSPTRDTKVQYIATSEVTEELIARADRVILFNAAGRIVGQFAPPQAVPRVDESTTSLPVKSLDFIRYPKLWENRGGIARANLQPYDLLALGTIAYDAGYDPVAEAALRAAAGLIPDNPYPYYFLGILEERRGNRAQARQWFDQAVNVAGQAKSPNPAFQAGVDRMR